MKQALEAWDGDEAAMVAYILRVRAMRRMVGMNQKEFTAHIGIPYKRWNHYENGFPMPREAAWVLYEKFRWWSSDWMYFGDESALSKNIRKALRAFINEERKKSR
jgi:DNA-binding XRE family transcriptional regulator